ncbi:MAG: di-heme-cytochrome C peroxidase, partial [Gammaproteobacteria bacterium]
IVRAPLAYKARPLNGIWATAPFLHNGSVPNLYQLLAPIEQRDRTFYTGNKAFDPVHVGFQTDSFPGGFELRTDKTGNSNKGHEFTDQKRTGVIGPLLTEEQRWQLIEYLKTL